MRLAVVLVLATASAVLGRPEPQGPPTPLCTAGLDASNMDLPIPTLAPPPGTPLASSRANRVNGRASYRCSVRYGAAVSAAAIADHINAQMRTMGWESAERDASASLVVSRYTGFSSGVPLSAVTIMTALDGTPFYDVAVHIVRHEGVGDPRRQSLPLLGRAGGEGAVARGTGTAEMATLDGLLRTAVPVIGAEAYVEGRSIPPGFPAEILPKGTDVRLSAASESHTTVVGVVSSLAIFEMPAHVIALGTSGWMARGLAHGLAATPPQGVELCRGPYTARVDFVPLPGERYAIRARRSLLSTSRCETDAFRTIVDDVAVPVLIPSGFRMIGSVGGGGPESFDSEIHGHTTLGADATAAELASQIVKGGWAIAREARVGPVTVIRAGRASVAGDPVTALVVVTPLPESFHLNLWLHVVRHKSVVPGR